MISVPEPRHRLPLVLGILATVLILILILVFVDPPQRTTGACVLEPARTWTLREPRSGSLRSRLNDRLAGRSGVHRLYQFDRPSFVEMSLTDADGARWVRRGERVAAVASTTLELEILEKRHELGEARAQLSILRGGAKDEAMALAELAVDRAQQELAAQELNHTRRRDLHERGLLTDEQWQESEAERELLRLDVSIAQAEVKDLAAGSTREKIAAAEEDVAALAEELVALEAMRESLAIRTPMDGRMRQGAGTGDLVSVVATDTMVAQILVPQRRAGGVHLGQAVRIALPGHSATTVAGRVVRVDDQVRCTSAGPFTPVYAVVENTDQELVEGMQGKATIVGPRRSLYRTLLGEFTGAVQQEVW